MENREYISEMSIKNKKVMLYLTKAVIGLNIKCNNIIKQEKFQRAIIMFINRNEDYETIKNMIDWHVENETKQYIERLNVKKQYKIKSLQTTQVVR